MTHKPSLIVKIEIRNIVKSSQPFLGKDNLSSQNVTNVTNVTANFEGYIYGPKDEPQIIILIIYIYIL